MIACNTCGNDGIWCRGAGGKYVPAKKGSGVVIEEDSHWPSTMPGHRHCCIHVDSVDVRTLFTVDLDRNEVFVHLRRDGVVLEGFMRHDVTPVTGRITDGQEDRNITASRFVESILSPLPPVHWIVDVIQKVWDW